MENLVTCNPEGNRQRWPQLAEIIDQMRTFGMEPKVLNIYEAGRLVAGNRVEFAADIEGQPKCKCGCIEPFCNCDLDDGPTYSPGVR